ncbi:hypothetical protein KC19_9G173000 [Ceratodon purpureus]|uniref:TIR domain-containing protein n=1 Tax=Ceratodon purpureus TaxID=3225 RepID=A0A8T0H130_CERPU|nr:hypothetical protein KC19_9G173000 [Ceratodon purpureus]
MTAGSRQTRSHEYFPPLQGSKAPAVAHRYADRILHLTPALVNFTRSPFRTLPAAPPIGESRSGFVDLLPKFSKSPKTLPRGMRHFQSPGSYKRKAGCTSGGFSLRFSIRSRSTSAALVSAPATANSLPVTEVGTFEQYDVFLCHRGPDTKFGFASYLSERLEGAGLRPFLDYKSIVHGQDSQACMDSAVKTTPIALVIFSEKFVDSEWCLNELDELMRFDARPVKVIPVFYKVKPDQVCFREETEEFKELKRKHGGSILRWKLALEKALNLGGTEYLGQSSEPELVNDIVQEVSKFRNKSLPLDVGNYVFGTKKVVDEIIQKHMGVSILLLWGMGGMGKSTLARELYNRLMETFDASCYVDLKSYDVEDSKKAIRDKDIVPEVQKHILKYLCPNEGQEVENKNKGKTILEERLSKKRFLMVLDDVPDNGELYFWISKTMLTKGSMCIVTSRNRRVVEELRDIDMKKDVHLHNVQRLGSEDSQYVFASFAFDGHWNVKSGFEELVLKISKACGGVPLVLTVYGALVKGEDVAIWKEVLEKLNKIDDTRGTYDTFGRAIFDRLRISFDALRSPEYQNMFLDITCALLGKPKDMAILAWKSHGWSPTIGIQVLVQRALVTVDSFGRFQTHDLLRDMGRQILEEQRSKGVITRLTTPESLTRLRENEGFPESLEVLIIVNTGFSGLRALDISHMKKLRILMCDDTINVSIPKSLCWWTLYVPWFKVSDIRYKAIHGPTHVITTLPTVPLPHNKLVVLSLARWRIAMLPDIVVRLEKLEMLDLRECTELRLLPDSFGRLRKLRQLNLERSGITSLPESFGELSNLEMLDLRECTELYRLPESFGELSNLEMLDLRECTELRLLPDSFGRLRKLRQLNLERTWITSLPASFGELSSLEVLNAEGCKMLHLLPDSLVGLRKLRDLNLEGSGITSLPASFGDLSSLEVLNLRGCKKLLLLPGSLTGLKNVKNFGYSGSAFASLLETMGCLKDFEESSLSSKLNTLQNLLGIMKTRKELVLEDFAIEALPESFGELGNLEVLNLRRCSNLRLLPDSFGGLSKLRDLNLEGSGITSLPASFGELGSLEVLNLRGCQKLHLLPESFGGLRKLRDLNLGLCRITSLPASFGELSSLEVLNAEGCEMLHLLPDSLVGLRKLRDLNLKGSGITSLPASFGDLSSLEVLNLRGCKKLLLLPGSLTGLKNVKNFGYSGSAFASLLKSMGCLKDFEESSLPSKLNTLQNLLGIMKTRKELVLEDFAIEALPESFGELGNLEVLNLRGCSNLRLLPDSFGGLSKLRDLNLEGSGITSLPASFGDLSSLEVLNLRGCEKLHLLPESFGGLRKLRDLNLGHCSITDSFGDLRKLRDLNLRDYCGIRSLPASFGELSSLEVLNAEGCKMLHLLPDSLVCLRKLRDLNLEGSGITSLPASFGDLSSLEVLNLRGCKKLLLLPGSLTGLKNVKNFGYSGSAFASLLKSMGCLKDFEESSLPSKLNTLQNLLGIMKTRKELVLEDFAIEALPESFGELGNLEVLILQECSQLALLPDSFGRLRKLRQLNLEGSGITSLPESFGELSNLEMLDLRECMHLCLLPDSFRRLRKLRQLNLERTWIMSSLPASFGELSSLEVLNAEGCEMLHLLPDSLVGLRKLRDLNLEFSGITSLPASFGDLSSLEVLNLRGCKKLLLLPGSLTGLKNVKNFGYSGSAFASLLESMGCLKDFEKSSLPSKLNTLQNLLGIMKTRKELVLEDFAIEALPESFGELGNLEVLNLRRCSNLRLLPDSFGGLSKLRDLNLEGSGITSLPASFGELGNLEVLNLRGCSKLCLLPDSFGHLRKLRDLNLRDYCGIRSLPESFGELSNLEVLKLGNSREYFSGVSGSENLLGDSTLNALRKLRELIIDGENLDVEEKREKARKTEVDVLWRTT